MPSTDGWIKGLRQNVEGWGQNIGGRIKAAYEGLSGTATSGEADALRATDPGVTVNQDGSPVRGNPTPRPASPVGPDFTVDPAGNARPAGMRSPQLTGPNVSGQQPAWGAGPSPEATAWQAEQAARDAQFAKAAQPAAAGGGGTPTPPEGPGLRGKFNAAFEPTGWAGKLAAKGLPWAAAAGEALDPNVRAAVDPTSDVSMKDRLRQAARTSLRVGGGFLGGAAGAASGLGVLSGPLAVAGGVSGYNVGDKVADYLVGPEKAAPAPAAVGGTAPATPVVESGSVGGSAPAGGTSGFQPLRGKAKIDANAFINGNATPEIGGGYIRNNQTGAISRRVGEGGASAYTGVPQTGGENTPSGLRALAGKGAFGGMAALGIQGAMDRMKSNSVNAGLRQQQIQATSDLARARMGYEMGKDARDYATQREDYNTKQADQDFEAYVRAAEPGQNTSSVPGLGEKPADYENRVRQAKAKLSDQINYSLGNRQDGKRIGQLSGTERQQLLDAHKFKTKLEASRGDLLNSGADFFGNKRADSKDLYSYMPAGAEGSVQPFSGGYKIQTMNGNTMTVKNAEGGGFNWTGPNDPVDADVMKYLAPYIKQAQAREQGK